MGNKVIAVDHGQRKVNALNLGRVSCVGSKLKTRLKKVRRLNNLIASCDLHNAILSTDITMICIATAVFKKQQLNQTI
jgi:UDP-glucose 6-dehydrogenase